MSDVRPHGATKDAQYVFSKIFVHDLKAMSKFYETVFGLVPFNRHQDVMFGRKIDEISYQSTYQSTYQGGSSLTLIKYLDSTGLACGESVQGFTTTDIVKMERPDMQERGLSAKRTQFRFCRTSKCQPGRATAETR